MESKGKNEQKSEKNEKEESLSAEDATAEIIEQIKNASEKDSELNKEGKPAVWKLTAIETVYPKLLNKKIHQDLLDGGVLVHLKKWLEPLPDNSLPPEEVKRQVLDALMKFDPEVEHLVESGIGKIILFYSKNPYEKKNIQTMAKKLVLKWIETAKEEA